MIHNYKKFINGEIFTKKDIIKILVDNKIECQIIDIKFYQYKKIYIRINQGGVISILKLCLHKHSITLAKNEALGYSYFNKEDDFKFNLPKYKQLNINEDYALSKINFIKGDRGNYFEFSSFYNNNFSNKLKKSTIENYISLTNDRFQINDYNNKDTYNFNAITKEILNKYKSNEVTLDSSHGDFINFNSIKTINKNYMIDLEFFRKDASFLYDYFHWHISPLIFKCARYGQQFFLLKIFPLLVKFLYSTFIKRYNKSIVNDEQSFKIYLILFLLDKHATLKFKSMLDGEDELTSHTQKKLVFKSADLFMDLLIKTLR